MPRSNRATIGELEARYEIIRDLIVAGYNAPEAYRFITQETNWNITKRQVYNYFKVVEERMAGEASDVDRATYFTRQLDRLDYLYHRAILKDDLHEARNLTNDVISMLRLDTPGADFDWKAKATEKGIDPSQLVESIKRLMTEDESVIGIKEHEGYEQA